MSLLRWRGNKVKIGSVSLLAGAAAKPVISRQDSGSRRGSSAGGETGAIPLAAHILRASSMAGPARQSHGRGVGRGTPSEGVLAGKDQSERRGCRNCSLATCKMSLTTIYKSQACTCLCVQDACKRIGLPDVYIFFFKKGTNYANWSFQMNCTYRL